LNTVSTRVASWVLPGCAIDSADSERGREGDLLGGELALRGAGRDGDAACSGN
jgi:hypothetical protein